jgi:hypothetical protein
MVGRGQVYVPFQLSDLREIKKKIWAAILMHLTNIFKALSL